MLIHICANQTCCWICVNLFNLRTMFYWNGQICYIFLSTDERRFSQMVWINCCAISSNRSVPNESVFIADEDWFKSVLICLICGQMSINSIVLTHYQSFVLKTWCAEIEQQSDFISGGFQIIQNLTVMVWSKAGQCFQFNNYFIVANEVSNITSAE